MAKTWTKKKANPRTTVDALAARRVLRDCYRMLHRLEKTSSNTADWRIGWFTLVSLLRAVGHVLDKVDKRRSSFLKAAIDAAWSRWTLNKTEHIIFHEFIKRERDLALKEYRLQTHAVSVGFEMDTSSSNPKPMLFNAQVTDPLCLARDAIDWWEQELRWVEETASAARPR